MIRPIEMSTLFSIAAGLALFVASCSNQTASPPDALSPDALPCEPLQQCPDDACGTVPNGCGATVRCGVDVCELNGGFGLGAQSGQRVAIGRSVAVVGVPHTADAGAVWVFERDVTTGQWTDGAVITPDDLEVGDAFGASVAVSDTVLVIGAPGENAAGAVYVFSRDNVAQPWRQMQKLPGATPGDRFGTSVDVDGATLVVGAAFAEYGVLTKPGRAIVFQLAGGRWVERASLRPRTAYDDQRFGVSVAVSGTRVVVGASGDDTQAPSAGAAYVFELREQGFEQVERLVADDGAQDDRLGTAVAISGDTVIAGAVGDDVGATDDAGSGYVFVRDDAGWRAVTQLLAPMVSSTRGYGLSVAVEGPRIVIGAATASPDTDAAYLHRRDPDGTWDGGATLVVPVLRADERRHAVSIRDASILVGAFSDTVAGAFVYER